MQSRHSLVKFTPELLLKFNSRNEGVKDAENNKRNN